MNQRLRNVILSVGASLFLLGAGFLLGHAVQAASNEPGSDADPLVTKSYVDEVIQNQKTYIDTQIGQMRDQQSQQIQQVKDQLNAQLMQQLNNSTQLQVVTIKAGQQLVAEAGVEIVLRAGKADAVGSNLGGLSDVTGGKDLQTGADIPLNHLLIVPRSDGRGLVARTEAVLMVRGPYAIK